MTLLSPVVMGSCDHRFRSSIAAFIHLGAAINTSEKKGGPLG